MEKIVRLMSVVVIAMALMIAFSGVASASWLTGYTPEKQTMMVEFNIELGHFYKQKIISNGVSEMKKELLILKRKKAKELHDKGWSNRRIAGHLFACKDSVMRVRLSPH